MNSAIRILLTLGPVVLGLALLLLPVFFMFWRSAPEPKRRLRLSFYLCASLGSGVLFYGAGTAAGIALACWAAEAGNLCGLFGFFGLGPLLAGLAIAGTAFWLLRIARQAP